MEWQEIPSERYLNHALDLSADERSRLEAALDVLPDTVIDAHTHIARYQDLEHMNEELTGHVVSTFPAYSLEMAEEVKRVLWRGKILRAARMAHAVVGYRHAAINEYLRTNLPEGDFFIAFGPAFRRPKCRRCSQLAE